MLEGLSSVQNSSADQEEPYLTKKPSKDSVTSTKFCESTEELPDESSHSSSSGRIQKLRNFGGAYEPDFVNLDCLAPGKRRITTTTTTTIQSALDSFDASKNSRVDIAGASQELDTSEDQYLSSTLDTPLPVQTAVDPQTPPSVQANSSVYSIGSADPSQVYQSGAYTSPPGHCSSIDYPAVNAENLGFANYSIPSLAQSYSSNAYTQAPAVDSFAYNHLPNPLTPSSPFETADPATYALDLYYQGTPASRPPISYGSTASPTHSPIVSTRPPITYGSTASPTHSPIVSTHPPISYGSTASPTHSPIVSTHPPITYGSTTSSTHSPIVSTHPPFTYGSTANPSSTMDFLNMYSGAATLGSSPAKPQDAGAVGDCLYNQSMSSTSISQMNQMNQMSQMSQMNQISGASFPSVHERGASELLYPEVEGSMIGRSVNGATVSSTTQQFERISGEYPGAGTCTQTTVKSGGDYSEQLVSQPDYSRATHSSHVVDKRIVQEGFDTIQIPKYREVEVVEKVVEVPVVHTVNKYVNKYELREVEKIVKRPINKYIETKIEVPEIHYQDKVVEVPEMHEIVKIVEKPQIQERTIYKSRIERKVIPKYIEVPVVQIVDKYEEYDDIQEVIKTVPVKKIVEVPNEIIKRVKVPVKKIIERPNYVPVIKYRDVPVEKIRYVPKIETVELVKMIPKIIDIHVPVKVPKIKYIDRPVYINKYVDRPVNVPVSKRIIPVYREGGKRIVDIPIHKPYIVHHDTHVPKFVDNEYFSGKRSMHTRPLDINGFSPAKQQELFQMVNSKDSHWERSMSVGNLQSHGLMDLQSPGDSSGLFSGSTPVMEPYMPGASNAQGLMNRSFMSNTVAGMGMGNGTMGQRNKSECDFGSMSSVRSSSFTGMNLNEAYGVGSNLKREDQDACPYYGPSLRNGSFSNPLTLHHPQMNSRNPGFPQGGVGMSATRPPAPGYMAVPTFPQNNSNFPYSSGTPKAVSFSNLPGPRSMMSPLKNFPNSGSCVSNRGGSMHGYMGGHMASPLPSRSDMGSRRTSVGSRGTSVGSFDGISAYAMEYTGAPTVNPMSTCETMAPRQGGGHPSFDGSNYSFRR